MPIIPPTLRASTPDLPNVPPFVQWLLAQFLTPILAWLETLVYRPLLHRCADLSILIPPTSLLPFVGASNRAGAQA